MFKSVLKKVITSLVLGSVIVSSTVLGVSETKAQMFFSGEVTKYDYLIEKYLNDDRYMFTVAKYDKANTESNKKRLQDWSYVFSFDEKDRNGKPSKGYVIISPKNWKVSNKIEPKEGTEYIIVTKVNNDARQGEGRLENIDAIEVVAKSNASNGANNTVTTCPEGKKMKVTRNAISGTVKRACK